MYAFVILIALALSLAVVQRTFDELVPIQAPAALTRTITVILAIAVAWLLDYSVFVAFGQDLRATWMHPVVTGLVLVAFGEFSRALVHAIARRAGEPPVEVAPTFTRVAA